MDDAIIEVHGHQEQAPGSASPGAWLNAFLATLTVTKRAPVIVAQRLRKVACGFPPAARPR